MKREIFIIFLLSLLLNLGNALIPAYYSPFFLAKGVNEATMGIIISLYSIGILITIPFYSHIMKVVGRKRIFIITAQTQVNLIHCVILIVNIYSTNFTSGFR